MLASFWDQKGFWSRMEHGMDGRMDDREIGTIESVPIGYSRLDNRVPVGVSVYEPV